MRPTYHPDAEAELAAAATFYENRFPGLGDRFLQSFDTAIHEIEAAPQRWPVVAGDLRCRTLKRFPFGIYDRLCPDEPRILVIKHHRQHPGRGQRRTWAGVLNPIGSQEPARPGRSGR